MIRLGLVERDLPPEEIRERGVDAYDFSHDKLREAAYRAVFAFALDASKDDFLFIVGAIMLVAALVVAGIGVAAALAALAVVRSVLACRAGSRGLAVAAGVAGLAIGLVLLASGVVETEVLWLACAGALTTSLGILAPAVEGAGEPPLI